MFTVKVSGIYTTALTLFLVEKGYKTTQIAATLKSELGLDISPSLIRRSLNKTVLEKTNN